MAGQGERRRRMQRGAADPAAGCAFFPGRRDHRSLRLFFARLSFTKCKKYVILGGNGNGGGPMAGKSRYTFDSKIHVYRATRRMTQQELADLVGVSRQTIIQLERNRYNPSMLLAYSIAQVFGVTIEDLFDFREA